MYLNSYRILISYKTAIYTFDFLNIKPKRYLTLEEKVKQYHVPYCRVVIVITAQS